MTEVKKSYGEKLVDDAIAKVRAEVRAEWYAEGYAEGIAEQRLIVSRALGMTLEQLEEILKEKNLL